ncbi:DNA primase large subunit-like [Bacillus rossius redtenbacheri]|uniref:DNA primase large subunit-like n=1 Tax=Bacillus rossius redtenbacheri TaxID=93214 RepID=UPI002FDC8213
MEVTQRRRVTKVASGSLLELYPHDLQLYVLPPTCNISLAEFETLALDRLKVLRIIEQVGIKEQVKNLEDKKNAVVAELKKSGLKSFARLMTGPGTGCSDAELQARKQDHISHFILRLAYCRSQELRRWFLSKELELFRLRFHSLSPEGVRSFLQINRLDYSPISAEMKASIKDKLYESTFMLSPAHVETLEFYRVPFTDVVDLVRARKIYLSQGSAFVPSSEFISVLSSVFRENLSHALAMTARRLPALEEDERLFRMLKGLHHTYTGDDYITSKNKAGVSIEELDSLSQKSFPLCMRHLHQHLRANHHLRHGGRLQYGLFLKGIGLSLEDAMRFWRSEFTRIMDSDKFEKQYAYNVRYNYGKEGKRTNYTPYSCLKIIMENVGPGDNHGCPFKHTDLPVLKQQLLGYGIPVAGIQQIADYVERGHYQIACGKYFELSHGMPAETGVNHPNQYFEQSQKILSGSANTFKVEPVAKNASSTPVATVDLAAGDDMMWDEDFNISALNESASVALEKGVP